MARSAFEAGDRDANGWSIQPTEARDGSQLAELTPLPRKANGLQCKDLSVAVTELPNRGPGLALAQQFVGLTSHDAGPAAVPSGGTTARPSSLARPRTGQPGRWRAGRQSLAVQSAKGALMSPTSTPAASQPETVRWAVEATIRCRTGCAGARSAGIRIRSIAALSAAPSRDAIATTSRTPTCILRNRRRTA